MEIVNERIRELIRESHLDVYGLGKDRYKWESTVDKFAEMIVAECTDKMYKVMQKTEQTDLAYNAMLTAIIADIHQSFNIKDSKADQFTRAMENAFKNGIDLSGQETP
jgi:hypothetical protein